jgi:hypothetical protein
VPSCAFFGIPIFRSKGKNNAHSNAAAPSNKPEVTSNIAALSLSLLSATKGG